MVEPVEVGGAVDTMMKSRPVNEERRCDLGDLGDDEARRK